MLDVQVDAGPEHNGNLSVDGQYNRKNMKESNRRQVIHDEIESALKKSIPLVEKNLKAKLNGAGRFTYPGTGTLLFSNPMFGKWGDLIAQISHKA